MFFFSLFVAREAARMGCVKDRGQMELKNKVNNISTIYSNESKTYSGYVLLNRLSEASQRFL